MAQDFPTRGDDSKEVIYSAVGYALTCWEGLEVELCGLYAAFNGWERALTEAIRGYSEGRIFRDREKAIRDAAEKWFRTHCCQQTEGRFEALITRAVDMSDRRNEIAHGAVQTFSRIQTGYTFCLAPPFYDRRKNVFRSGGYLDFRPSYAYVSEQIRGFGNSFDALRIEVLNFGQGICAGRNR